ncbi:hypothetical protein KVT40_000542 [Elsinoe batatas]|uniref:Uncharacterized protein n=1 Tax=Elsinoe batatas TaxID=2601811 RepID=A0A8K0L8Y9_9PEZI|nr:hypothetical protein KVT40_000542 [Elsinoe batatas]
MPEASPSVAWAQHDDVEKRSVFAGLRKFFRQSKKTPPQQVPARIRYTPKYAYRDAVRSFRPSPPVIPRDLRCLDSNFIMDRLAPRAFGGFIDDNWPSSDSAYTYKDEIPQTTGKGKGKEKAVFTELARSGSSASDHLGAPLNANMSLATSRMPIYQNPYAATTGSDSALYRTVRLADGLDYPSPAAQARWFRGDNDVMDTGVPISGQLPNLENTSPDRPCIPRLRSWELAATGNSSMGRQRRAFLHRTHSCSDVPRVGTSATPGVYLAAQRHALVERDQIYWRQGNVPHVLQRSHSMHRRSLPQRAESSSSSSSSTTAPYPSSNNSSYQKLHTTKHNGQPDSFDRGSESSSSQDESQPSSASQASVARATIHEDSEGEAKAEADQPSKSLATDASYCTSPSLDHTIIDEAEAPLQDAAETGTVETPQRPHLAPVQTNHDDDAADPALVSPTTTLTPVRSSPLKTPTSSKFREEFEDVDIKTRRTSFPDVDELVSSPVNLRGSIEIDGLKRTSIGRDYKTTPDNDETLDKDDMDKRQIILGNDQDVSDPMLAGSAGVARHQGEDAGATDEGDLEQHDDVAESNKSKGEDASGHKRADSAQNPAETEGYERSSACG